MKRSAPIIAALAALVVALYVWRRSPTAITKPSTATTTQTSAVAPRGSSRPDPVALARGSLAGTVTAATTNAAIANATVCAYGRSASLAGEWFARPFCATTNATGAYVIDKLLPGTFAIVAMAPTFVPDGHHPGGDRRAKDVPLALGEKKAGIDIALDPGGVEITGTVLDLTGGPIAHARVWVVLTGYPPATESDDTGAFSLWVAPGRTELVASADGYSNGYALANAPGGTELLLAPESSIAGTVVDGASGKPVEGARVQTEFKDASAVYSDERGAFRISHLDPGRWRLVAATEGGVGYSEGTVRAALGEAADGVVVKLYPAARVSGRVLVSGTEQPCPSAYAALSDLTRNTSRDLRLDVDGTLSLEGVRPATYKVVFGCPGFVTQGEPPSLVVDDKPILDQVWHVSAAGGVRGIVRTASGLPAARTNVHVRKAEGADGPDVFDNDTTARDGSYELRGLPDGAYELRASGDDGIEPAPIRVVVKGMITQDITLGAAGRIHGTVVDDANVAVANATVIALPLARGVYRQQVGTDEHGAFDIPGVAPGAYMLQAFHASDADTDPADIKQTGKRLVIKANETATIALSLPSAHGTIRGHVTDADSKPVSDAYITWAKSSPENDGAGDLGWTRWIADLHPVLTGVDGSFALTKLTDGEYIILAGRKGGGEAIAKHVAVGTTTVSLVIARTGTIRGVAHRAAPIEDLSCRLSAATGVARLETFDRTDGRFVLTDLPAGHYSLELMTPGGHGATEIDLAAGQSTDVIVELEALHAVHGRVLDAQSKAPIAGVFMSAAALGSPIDFNGGAPAAQTTDARGAFTIENMPTGRLGLAGYPSDATGYTELDAARTVGADGNVGDLLLAHPRSRPGEQAGSLGFTVTDTTVTAITPNGPAAKTGLVAGDIITSVDGISVGGDEVDNFRSLVEAPPGTKLSLGLARAETVTLVLGPP